MRKMRNTRKMRREEEEEEAQERIGNRQVKEDGEAANEVNLEKMEKTMRWIKTRSIHV